MTPLRNENRREKRSPATLGVRFVLNGREHRAVTRDISFHGLFVYTHLSPQVRQLLRLSVELPGRTEPFVLHAMVVRVEAGDPETGKRSGIGLSLYGLGDEDRATWETAVRAIGGAPGRLCTAPRRSERLKATPIAHGAPLFECRPKTVHELRALCFHAARRGAFVRTSLPVSGGDTIAVTLVHPETQQRLKVRCVSRAVVEHEDGRGVTLAFADMLPPEREALRAFVADPPAMQAAC